MFAKVDDHWFDYLNQWKWHYDGKYARMIYDLNAHALFGEYARLNFPGSILVVQE